MEGPVKYALVAVSAATEAFDAEYTYEMDPEITAAAKAEILFAVFLELIFIVNPPRICFYMISL